MRQLVAVLVAVFAASAFGQAFPTRPITMIVPYAAGGSADVVARPVAAEMGKVLGENVVVELRPGAEPIPGYRLVGLLGRGGFGEVWKADGPGGFRVALKFVPLSEPVGAAELRALRVQLLTEITTIAARVPQAAARRSERLRERLRTMLADAPLDETRIITEVAVWAQKTDITEELARLRAHLEDLSAKLDKGGPVGRPLDFLIQELNREVNTLGAKADDLELSQAALAAKGMLEKMREQVQNLE